MTAFKEIAPAFVEMAHNIVWCTAATVDAKGRPRSRVLHPLWQWDGETLTDWIATGPTPTKLAHLDVGYDPAMIPAWENAETPGFAALKLDPWRLRVMPGSVLIESKVDLLLSWQA